MGVRYAACVARWEEEADVIRAVSLSHTHACMQSYTCTLLTHTHTYMHVHEEAAVIRGKPVHVYVCMCVCVCEPSMPTYKRAYMQACMMHTNE